jgi:serine/threonine protein kinase
VRNTHHCTLSSSPANACGTRYERTEIEKWLATNSSSPKTGLQLTSTTLVRAHALRNAIEEWEASHLLKIPRESLVIGEEVGAGSFKVVHRALLSVPGAPQPMVVAALKMRRGLNDAEARTFLKMGRHPRLVRFYGQCEDGETYVLVTEFARQGSLSDSMERLEATITLSHKVVMLQQICAGMSALAESGVVHRDLAIRNVLLFAYDPDNVSATSVKLCDFGMSVSSYGNTHRTIAAGELPIRYLPPESLMKRRFSEKSDVWAFGVTAWELLTDGTIPYFELADADVTAHVCGGGRLARPPGCPDGLWKMIQGCWAKSPQDRPTFAQLAVELGTLSL